MTGKYHICIQRSDNEICLWLEKLEIDKCQRCVTTKEVWKAFLCFFEGKYLIKDDTCGFYCNPCAEKNGYELYPIKVKTRREAIKYFKARVVAELV